MFFYPDRKTNLFVCFLGEVTAQQFFFGDLLTFNSNPELIDSSLQDLNAMILPVCTTSLMTCFKNEANSFIFGLDIYNTALKIKFIGISTTAAVNNLLCMKIVNGFIFKNLKIRQKYKREFGIHIKKSVERLQNLEKQYGRTSVHLIDYH